MRFWAISAILLVGCGPMPDYNAYIVQVDPVLGEYMQRYERELNISVSGISAKFGPLSERTMAMCTIWTDGRRLITVDPTSWADSSELGKEQLIYHELGHCAQNLDHDRRLIVETHGNTIYGNIMYPYSFGDAWFYNMYRPEYKYALKNKTVIVPGTTL